MKSVWALDLGYSAVKAVKMVRSGAALVVQAFDIIPLSGGSVDLGRETLLAGAIGALASRQKLRADGIFIAIPGKGVLTKFISLPPVEKKRIPEIVNYEARQQIPFDLSEVIWRYQQVKEEFAPGEPVEISLIAARRDSVGEMIDALGPYRKSLAGVQVAPLALYNFVKYDQAPSGPTVVIDIGAEVTDLVVCSESGFWPRGLHIAGNSVNRSLEEQFKVAFDEAESIKQGISESKFRKQIMDLLQPIFRELIGEIQRSLGYYKSLSKDVRFDEILVLGNGLKLAGLERFLAENLQYNVRKFTDLQRIQLGRGVDPNQFAQALPGLGVALGLGVQALGMGEVSANLLPEEFVVAREVQRKKPIAVAALLAVILGLGLMHVRATRTRDVIYNVMARDESKKVLDRAKELEKRYNDEANKVSYANLDFLTGVATRVGIPEKGEGDEAATADMPGMKRDFWLECMTRIRDVVPENVYLQSLRVQIADPATLDKGKEDVPVDIEAPDVGQPDVDVKGDPTASRVIITLTVENESTLGFKQINPFIDKLKKLKWGRYKVPVFKSVTKLQSKQISRDGMGREVGGTPGPGPGAAPDDRGRDVNEETVRNRILRREVNKYLVVPIRIVTKTVREIKEEEAAKAASASSE